MLQKKWPRPVNLATILTLPLSQRKGYAKFLVAFCRLTFLCYIQHYLTVGFFWGETKLYLPCTIFFVDELSLLLQPTDFLTRKVKCRHRTIMSLILVHSVRRLLDYSAAVSLDKHKSNISIEVSAVFLSFYLALLLQFLQHPFQQFIELSYKTHTFF